MSLSDKIGKCNMNEQLISVKDVKQAVKELKEKLRTGANINVTIDEIFGEGLV